MTRADDRLHPLTRLVGVVGIALTLGTGLGLWLLPDSTEEYWAWVIKAPLSAAFLGAAYVGAATSIALALRTHRWALARTSFVSAFVLTSLALLATARQSDTFLLGTGDALPRAVAWTWLVVYVALPPLVLLAFLLQARRHSPDERRSPLAPASSVALAAVSVALVVPGALLVAHWEPLVDHWPWPLAPLPAELVGSWLVTAAVTLGWIVLRERDWERSRPALTAAIVFGVLLLLAALRLRDGFVDDSRAAVYVAGVVLVVAVFAAVSLAEERRFRSSRPVR